MDLIIDVRKAPEWVRKKFPDSCPMDSTGRKYEIALSMFHKEANAMAFDVIRKVAEHLNNKFSGCAVAIQPTWNNEYESKFTQEFDAYQVSSRPLPTAFPIWLAARLPCSLGVKPSPR